MNGSRLGFNGIKHSRGIDQRGPGIHRDSYAKGFGKLFLGHSALSAASVGKTMQPSQRVATATASEISCLIFSPSMGSFEFAAGRV